MTPTRMIDYPASYAQMYNTGSKEEQMKMAKAVTAMFNAQNQREEEHADKDMRICRMAFVELVANRDDDESDDFFLNTITHCPDASVKVGVEMFKERLVKCFVENN